MIASTTIKTHRRSGRDYLAGAWIRTSRPQVRRMIAELRAARVLLGELEVLVAEGVKGSKAEKKAKTAEIRGLEREIKAGRKGVKLAAQGLLIALQTGHNVTRGERGHLWATFRGLAEAQGLSEPEALRLLAA